MAMSTPKKKKKTAERERERTGYVMVQLDEADRLRLEEIRDALEAGHGGRVGLAGALRWLIRNSEKIRRNA